MSAFLFLLIVCSGGVWGIIGRKYSFNMGVAITCMGCCMILYLFALIDQLILGVYGIIFLACLAYTCSAVAVISKRKNLWGGVQHIVLICPL